MADRDEDYTEKHPEPRLDVREQVGAFGPDVIVRFPLAFELEVALDARCRAAEPPSSRGRR